MTSNEMKLEVGAICRIGNVRKENQDRMSAILVNLGQLYIVADGMGGHKGGALAASMTVEGLERHLRAASVDVPVADVIKAAFDKTNQVVYERAHSGDANHEGMGATATILLLQGDTARFAWVGDSPLYRFRGGKLHQLTKDHTKVQRMVDAGIISLQQAFDHPDASVLERAIGHRPNVDVEIGSEFRLQPGDGILMCSDGLSGYIVNSRIETVLRSKATVQEIPEELLALALEAGGEDNITIQYIQYGERAESKVPLLKPQGTDDKQTIDDKRITSDIEAAKPKVDRKKSEKAQPARATQKVSRTKNRATKPAKRHSIIWERTAVAILFFLLIIGGGSSVYYIRILNSQIVTLTNTEKYDKWQNEKNNLQSQLAAAAKDASDQIKILNQKLSKTTQENKKLTGVVKQHSRQLPEINSEIQLIVLLHDGSVWQKLESKFLLELIGDIGSARIVRLAQDQWPEINGLLPDTATLYYTQELNKEIEEDKIRALGNDFGIQKIVKYGNKHKQLRSKAEKKYGAKHILVYLKDTKIVKPEKPSIPSAPKSNEVSRAKLTKDAKKAKELDEAKGEEE